MLESASQSGLVSLCADRSWQQECRVLGLFLLCRGESLMTEADSTVIGDFEAISWEIRMAHCCFHAYLLDSSFVPCDGTS